MSRRSVLLAVGIAVCVPAVGAAQSGSDWTRSPTPEPAAGGRLVGISCPAPSECLAVGVAFGRRGRSSPLIERWNANTWSRQTPARTRALTANLNGISCPSPSMCVAVGSAFNAGSPSPPLSERWNGKRWSALETPAPRGGIPGQSIAELWGVSCPSRNSCIAVGDFTGGSFARPLVERWNGRSWRFTIAPAHSRFANRLDAVSCVTPKSCIAVGQYFTNRTGNRGETLAEGFNGRRWRILKSSSLAAATEATLGAISCTSASACTTVGGNDGKAVVLRWNGRAFARQNTPTLGNGTLRPNLSGVSCTTATACTAVGSLDPFGPNAERWDGKQWTLDQMAGIGSGTIDAFSVSCVQSGACVAVGSYSTGSGGGQREHPFAESSAGT